MAILGYKSGSIWLHIGATEKRLVSLDLSHRVTPEYDFTFYKPITYTALASKNPLATDGLTDTTGADSTQG